MPCTKVKYRCKTLISDSINYIELNIDKKTLHDVESKGSFNDSMPLDKQMGIKLKKKKKKRAYYIKVRSFCSAGNDDQNKKTGR